MWGGLENRNRKVRGFESYSLRQKSSLKYSEEYESAEGARLLSECGGKPPPKV